MLIKEKIQLDTASLLARAQTKKAIKKNDFVLVFKNNALVEAACRQNGWRLLNPDWKLADKIEGKISQVKWLGKLARYLPPHRIVMGADLRWRGRPFILQFNHSHTGSGTLYIDSAKKAAYLKQKFSRREMRVTDFIKGPVFTNNNVVWGGKILTGNISYQITGLPPFTDNPFATIGNDWALSHKILSEKQISRYKKIATEVGKKLNRDGWKGLYGIDIIVDEKNGRLYLLEINARQPASAAFESQLQKSKAGDQGSAITMFEAHLASLLEIKNNKYKFIEISDGAQIVQRVTKKPIKINTAKIKDKSIINIIKYNNTLPGSDLIRFQFTKGLMKRHGVLNALGQKI